MRYLVWHILDWRPWIEFALGYSVDWELTLKALGAVGIPATLLLTWSAHHQRTTFEMIDGLYSLCQKLEDHLLNEWRLAHLFCIGSARYYETCHAIKKSLPKDPTAPSETALIEKERLFAIHVMIIYEQVYYHWRETSSILRQRKRFLREMLTYFTDRLLCNPRLRAYLISDKVGESLHLESESRRFLRDRLPDNDTDVDQNGPFDYRLTPIPGELAALSPIQRMRWRLRLRSARRT